MLRFPIVVEKANGNYSAYSPDVPGCGAVGDSLEEARENLREAIKFHLDGLAEDNQPLPKPQSTVEYITL